MNGIYNVFRAQIRSVHREAELGRFFANALAGNKMRRLVD